MFMKKARTFFVQRGKGVDHVLRHISKLKMSDGQEAPPEVLAINK